MADPVAWLIVIGFYAPLHFLLPVLVLFITGHETEALRRKLIRHALIDAGVSMIAAFALAIYLAQEEDLSTAMLILLLSMAVPFVRIWRHRREITD
jgi:hypothetical protein